MDPLDGAALWPVVRALHRAPRWHPGLLAIWGDYGLSDPEDVAIALRLVPVLPCGPQLASSLLADLPAAKVETVLAVVLPSLHAAEPLSMTAGETMAESQGNLPAVLDPAGARWASVDAVFAPMAADLSVATLAELGDLLRGLAEGCVAAGSPLAAAGLDEPWSDRPHRVLWQAASVLHEHRTACVQAGLRVAELTSDEAALLRGADVAAAQPAVQRLRSRGLLDANGATEAGRTQVEIAVRRAERMADEPLALLGRTGADRLSRLLPEVLEPLRSAGLMPTTDEDLTSAAVVRRRPRFTPPARAIDEPVRPPRDLIHVTVVLGGLDTDEGPFLAMFDANPEIDVVTARHPEAERLFHPRAAATTDVFVMYDLPGVLMDRGRPPRYPQPRDLYVAGFHRLLEAGKPMVFLHHAIGGWPAWAEYAEIVGGRFNYSSCMMRGRRYPASGHRTGVRQRITPVDPAHPICEGIGDGFDLVDEVLLHPVFDAAITPLLRSDFSFVDTDVTPVSVTLEPGSRDPSWRHPPGNGVIAWAKAYERSPIVYLQPGHGPSTFANPSYRRLLANAIRWAASPEAKTWVQDHTAPGLTLTKG